LVKAEQEVGHSQNMPHNCKGKVYDSTFFVFSHQRESQI